MSGHVGLQVDVAPGKCVRRVSFWHLIPVALAMVTVLCGNAQASSTVTRTSSWTYDSTGLITSETVQPNNSTANGCLSTTGNSCVTTSYTYDAYGNKTVVTISGSNITSRATTTTYDTTAAEFVTQVKNALNQTETWSYDPRFGVPLSHTGPNGLATSWSYDTLGRKTVENRADGTFTTWGYYYGSNNNPLEAFYTSTSVFASGNSQIAPGVINTYDTLGRLIQSFQQIYNGSNLGFSEADTQYDAFGRVAQTSPPQFSGDVWTTFTYDALGRVIKAVKPYGSTGSTTTYEYDGLTSSVTDAQSRTTTTTNNDMGLPISVTDAAGTVTKYSYDAVGDMVQIKTQNNNITNFNYDTEGRKTDMFDPDRGHWTYTYDALGELLTQTDALSQTTSFTYDSLGRMLTRVQPKQTDKWTYDTASGGYGIGKLAESESDNTSGSSVPIAVHCYTYDAYGRPSQTETATGSSSPTTCPSSPAAPFYTTTTTYDSGSRLNTVTYPSTFQIQYAYTTIGTPSTLTSLSDGGVLWALNTNNAASEITQETFGSNSGQVVVNHTYDTNTQQLLTTTAGSGTNATNFTYTYDNLGNLSTRADSYEAVSEAFGYDNLYRLTSYSVNGATAKTVTYGIAGNITAKSDVGTYNYTGGAYPGSGPATHPHAVSSITSSGGNAPYNLNTSYTYDADGNQLTGNGNGSSGHPIVWTSYNLASSIPHGTTPVSYTYDADHNRITYTAPEGTTQYLNDPTSGARSERLTSGTNVTWTDYFFAGGQMVGMRVKPPTGTAYHRYFIHDHLGSVAVVYDDNGTVVERDSYDAWGKRRNPNGADDVPGTITSITSRGYTGHEHIQDIGLINMNARMYDPLTGRFLSPDPVTQAPFNLQDLNLYSYVLNNPLSATDPTGMKCKGWFNCTFGGYGLQIVAVIAAAALQYEALPAIETAAFGTSYAVANAVLAGAAAGAIESGGNLQDTLISAAEAGAFYKVGSLTGLSSNFAGTNPYEAEIANIAGHGLVGGLANLAGGGSFQSGFLAAGFGDVATYATTGGYEIEQVAAAATAGGTASALSGGSFGNGAETAAYGYLYNQLAHQIGQDVRLTYDEIKSLVEANNNSGQSDDLIIAVAWKESKFIPGSQSSTTSAGGLMQVESGAETDLKDRGLLPNDFDVYDAAQNIAAGSAYLGLRIQWAGGNITQGLDGYGTGPGYATNILQAAGDLESNPLNPTQTLIKDIGPP